MQQENSPGATSDVQAGTHISRAEVRLAIGVVTLIVLALLLPAIAQAPEYHQFADARTMLGIPRAMDALSNFAFLFVGLWGLSLMVRKELQFFSRAMAICCGVFFLGFVTTAAGSYVYHVAPDDPRLAWDRAGMVIAFAGMLAMAATQRVSDRAGLALLVASLALGQASVLWWMASGSVTPYAVVQFGSIALASALMLLPSRGVGPDWKFLLLTYAAAKVAEIADISVFVSTGGFLSGHTLKHLLAALPAVEVIMALHKARQQESTTTAKI